MHKRIPVLICGAGPVGMTASLALSRLGIDNLVVEKHKATSFHPKARGLNVRCIELFRALGVEQTVRHHELPKEAARLMWMDRLKGKVVADAPINCEPSDHSPCTASMVTQDHVEQALFDQLMQETRSEVMMYHRLVSVEETDDSVICVIHDRESGDEFTVVCDYLFAADGAKSFVRSALDIPMDGVPNLGNFVSVLCRADIKAWMTERPAAVTVFTDERQRSRVLMAVDLDQTWMFAQRLSPDHGEFTDDDAVALARYIAEDDDLEVELINTSLWEMAAMNARQYRQGRVFLMGDAAHRIPPTGGMGLNTGVQDGHNLAWKVAYVLQGKCDESLLDSYEPERKSIARMTIDWSSSNAKRLMTMMKSIEDGDQASFGELLSAQREQLDHPGLDLGFRYVSNAVARCDNPAPDFDVTCYEPTLAPGYRAPHCWVVVDGRRVSTLDLFEKRFCVLLGRKADENTWWEAMPVYKNCPVDIYRLGDNIEGDDERFDKYYELGDTGAVLVRPDGFVAWCLFDN